MAEAHAVCKTLGFARAFGAFPRFGGADDLHPIRTRVSCPPDAPDLSACGIQVLSAREVCSSVGVACVAAGTERSDEDMKAADRAIDAWRKQAQMQKQSDSASVPMSNDAACDILDGVPLPFSPEETSRAFVFVDRISAEYAKMDAALRARLCGDLELQRFLVSMVERGLRWNALGMDMSTLSRNATLDELALLRDVYTSHNPHALIHDNLDQPQRQRDGTETCPDDGTALDDARDRAMFDALQANGIVHVDDFGLTDQELSALSKDAEALFDGEMIPNASVSITSGGLVATARFPLPQIDDLLLRNASIRGVINAYLGNAMLDGYKVTKLATTNKRGESAYVASRWHHDRTGRRLKMFVYLHDVDCEEGHPTQVASGTNNMLYYRTDSLHASRFRDEYVREHFNVTLGCGKRGSGFIFDTHTVHKGTPEGTHTRTTVIAEFHNVLKCPAVRRLGYQLPCPSGDQFMVQRRLEK